jgi:hypothetical protein
MASKGIAALFVAGLLGGAAFVAVRAAKAAPKPGDERPVGAKYYRSRLEDMPQELYDRYENCMQGECSFDDVANLSDEMRGLGYTDFANDLATLAAEMVAAPDPVDPPTPPTPGQVSSPGLPPIPGTMPDAPREDRADLARDLASVVKGNCGKILRGDMIRYQTALGVNPTGVYDAQTALAVASYGIIPPPAPCELPLPADWDSQVDRWVGEMMNGSQLPSNSVDRMLGYQPR